MTDPNYLIITDIHADEDNIQQVFDIVKQAIDICSNNRIPLYCGGDVFDSRRSQSLTVLDLWSELLDYCELKSVEMRCIPGNHDKMDYKSERSYLDLYQRHPAFKLTRDYQFYDHDNIRVHMIPFFSEKDIYPQYLQRVQYGDGINHLITHIATDGVRNNDGSMIADTLSVDLFSKFDKVFVGHYHDKQTIRNIHYIGSCKQKDYGEDDDKGFTLVDKSGNHSSIETQFKKFVVVKIDIDNANQKQLEQFAQQYQDQDINVRFKLIGSKQASAMIDQSKLMQLGIDVKYEYKEEINLINNKTEDFVGFNKDSILSEWDIFCQSNPEIDQTQGKEYLQITLK